MRPTKRAASTHPNLILLILYIIFIFIFYLFYYLFYFLKKNFWHLQKEFYFKITMFLNSYKKIVGGKMLTVLSYPKALPESPKKFSKIWNMGGGGRGPNLTFTKIFEKKWKSYSYLEIVFPPVSPRYLISKKFRFSKNRV